MPLINPQGADVSGFNYLGQSAASQSGATPQTLDINLPSPDPIAQATSAATSVGAAAAARQAVNALFPSGVQAPTIVNASRIPAQTAISSGGGSATGGGGAAMQGVQSGVNPAIPIAVAIIAGELLKKHGEKYVGKPVADAGRTVAEAVGLSSGERRQASPSELATSELFEKQIPGFEQLSEEQQAQVIESWQQAGLIRNPGARSDSIDFGEQSRNVNAQLAGSGINSPTKFTPGFRFGREDLGKNITLENMLAFGARPGMERVVQPGQADQFSYQPTAEATWNQMTIPERLALLDRMEQGGVPVASEAAPTRDAYAELIGALGGQDANQ